MTNDDKTIVTLGDEVIRLKLENQRLREACREAFLFVTAPLNSPRLWPTNRGNLTKMLEKALGEETAP